MESQAQSRAALFGVIELSERTLVSILRTAILGGVGAMFALSHAEATHILDAIVLGAVLADFITWLARSLMELPENILHGGYDAAVNLGFAGFYFHIAQLNTADDGTSLMAAFVAFMLVLGAKIGYYGLQHVARMSSGW